MAVAFREKVRRLRDTFTVLFENEMLLRGPGRIFDAVADEFETNAPREIFTWIAGMTGLEEWLGERKLADMKAYEIEVQPRKFENGIVMRREDIDDDRFQMYIRQIQEMAEDYNRKRRAQIVELLENGEDATAFDGNPFFGERTNDQGQVQTNLTTNGAMDANTFYEVKKKMQRLKNDAGKFYNIRPDTLIIGPELEQEADALFKNLFATRHYDGSSGRNNDNLAFGMIPEGNIIVDPYMDESTNFYLVDSTKPLKPVFSTVRDQPEMQMLGPESDFYKMNDKLYWGIRTRYEITYGVWMPIHKVTTS